MASADGREPAGVSRTLWESPYRFDFYQAVRVLEYLRRERRGDEPASVGAVGHDDVEGELVRFRAQVSLSFPAAAISELRHPTGDGGEVDAPSPPEMTVTFLGLTGPSGVLPRHYTELMVQRVRQKDSALRDFLDSAAASTSTTKPSSSSADTSRTTPGRRRPWNVPWKTTSRGPSACNSARASG
jgi:type VI secretion system protein ImpH